MGAGPYCRSAESRDSAGMYACANHGSVPCTPPAIAGAIDGCSRPRRCSSSRAAPRRLACSGSRSSVNALTATSRPSALSWARNTGPSVPAPTWWSTRKGPNPSGIVPRNVSDVRDQTPRGVPQIVTCAGASLQHSRVVVLTRRQALCESTDSVPVQPIPSSDSAFRRRHRSAPAALDATAGGGLRL